MFQNLSLFLILNISESSFNMSFKKSELSLYTLANRNSAFTLNKQTKNLGGTIMLIAVSKWLFTVIFVYWQWLELHQQYNHHEEQWGFSSKQKNYTSNLIKFSVKENRILILRNMKSFSYPILLCRTLEKSPNL